MKDIYTDHFVAKAKALNKQTNEVTSTINRLMKELSDDQLKQSFAEEIRKTANSHLRPNSQLVWSLSSAKKRKRGESPQPSQSSSSHQSKPKSPQPSQLSSSHQSKPKSSHTPTTSQSAVENKTRPDGTNLEADLLLSDEGELL